MDTGTHVVMGIALGGLATDPVVASSSATATSVLIATIAGSQIPDIDTVLKLRNNAIYIRNHRGVTHSIPAVLLWPLVLLAVIYPFSLMQIFFTYGVGLSRRFLSMCLLIFLMLMVHKLLDLSHPNG